MQKIADERKERARKAQEEAFIRDIEHMKEKHDKNGVHQ